ncbi:cytochrome oxidase small assembly protein [Caballeronia insecticola]|uniref:Putative membrane protein n=1 Tax=Caballeronia insecticola TaxID=758793 RepID=R4WVN2_9BURK|nr:cytochrome oxidase small assembly protein [Caballeronia insecticola]BAN21962.1 putative membrane protein [Caballeronia insecticola]
MTLDPQKRRTPEEIRAGNKRLGIVMVLIAAVFFVGIVVRQYLLSRG